MGSLMGGVGIDMNDPLNLDLYRQLCRLQDDISRREVLWHNPENLLQRSLQALAHSLGLEYEFSLATRIARISKPMLVDRSLISGSENLDFMNLDVDANVNDSAISHNTSGISNSSFPNDLGIGPSMYLSNIQMDFQASFDSANPDLTGSNGEDPTWDGDWNLDLPTVTRTLEKGMDIEELKAANTAPTYETLPPKRFRVTDDQRRRLMTEYVMSPTLTADTKRKIAEGIGLTESRVKSWFRNRQRLEREQLQSEQGLKSAEQGSSSSRSTTGLPQPMIFHGTNSPSAPSYEAMTFSPARTSSRSASASASVSSFQSDSGRNGFMDLSNGSRRQSFQNGGSSGYQEIVFDASSLHSSSQLSLASGTSGRRGPLDEVARIAMNAVRRVGACWRCKFLRKTCNPENPCELCPKGTVSNWGAVGCKRGKFKTAMLPIKICPRASSSGSHISLGVNFGYTEKFGPAQHLKETAERREAELKGLGALSTLPERWDVVSGCFQGTRYLMTNMNRPALLVPLNECVLTIIWELFDNPLSWTLLNTGQTCDEFVLLLRSAAAYQAKLESNELIAQSLICLRSCLRVMRLKAEGLLENSIHLYCNLLSCKVESLSNLQLNLDIYLDKLSRVFFKKDNLRNKKPWWLSTFYSFCIQSVVRKALIHLTNSWTNGENMASKQYLHLSVRLFVASSADYDPLMNDSSITSTDREGTVHGDFLAARHALAWTGRQCSGKFLTTSFEDDGDEIAALDTSTNNFSDGGSDGESVPSHTLPVQSELMSRRVPSQGSQSSSTMSQFSSKVSTSAQKKHKCKVCDKRFIRPSALQTHIYTHTSKKPLRCEVEECGR